MYGALADKVIDNIDATILFCFGSLCLVFDGRLFFPFALEMYTFFLKDFMPLDRKFPMASLLGLGLMHVCTCGGSFLPRRASQSGHVLQSSEIFVISSPERMILSSILYCTCMHGWIREDV